MFLWAFVVVLLYFLSIGPVVMMTNKGYVNPPPSNKFLNALYSPLLWVDEKTILGKLLDIYIDWCDVHSQRTKTIPPAQGGKR